jgi:hypothetical protein
MSQSAIDRPARSSVEIVAVVLGIISLIIPVVTFGWRLLSLILVAGALFDLCLRSPQTKQFSPGVRVLVSLGALTSLIAVTWNPIRKQYRDENLPPSFVYVVPGFWSPSPTPQWFMAIRHYGPQSVYNTELVFDDLDRRKLMGQQSAVTPQEIERTELTFHYPEIDPTEGFWTKLFPWRPLHPDHEHFSAVSVSKNGRFSESFQIEQIAAGEWQYQMQVLDVRTSAKIIDCRDPKFPSASSDLPACFPAFVTQHQGDATLPLQLPSDPNVRVMMIAVLTYALMVLIPLYGLFALWWLT